MNDSGSLQTQQHPQSCALLISTILSSFCATLVQRKGPLTPTDDVTFKADSVLLSVIDILANEGVTKTVLIYDDKNYLLTQELISNAQQSKVDFLALTVPQFIFDSVWQHRLEGLRARFQTYMVLMPDTIDVASFINKASDLDLLSPIFNWVFLGDTQLHGEILSSQVPVTSNVVFIDTRLECLSDGDPTANFSRIKAPLRDCNFSDLIQLSSHMKAYQEECSEIILRSSTEVNGTAGVRVFSTSESEDTGLSFVGFWNYKENKTPPVPLIKPFKGLRGKVFQITTVPNKIFQVIQSDGTFRGLAFDILNELSRKLNFTYVIVRPPDGQWGTENPSGSWTGMIGQIVRKEVDFGVASFTVTSQRASAVNFTLPIWRGSTSMLLATTTDTDYFAYLNPFDVEVLLCITVAILIISTLIWILAKLHPGERNPTNHMSHGLSNLSAASYGDVLMRMFGVLFTQDIPWRIHTMSVRWMVGSLLFCHLIIGATYTGNLVALLTVTSATAPVDSLYDLVHATGYQVGLVKGQALVQVLNESNHGSLYYDLWQKIATDFDTNLVSDLSQGFNRVLEEKFIFMDDTKNLRSLVSEAEQAVKCRLHIGKEKFFYSYYAFPLQLNSPYLDLFNQKIEAMIETGLIDYWRAKYGGTNEANGCKTEESLLTASSIGLNHVSGNFLLLLVGLGISFIVLMTEITWKKTVSKIKMAKNIQNKPFS